MARALFDTCAEDNLDLRSTFTAQPGERLPEPMTDELAKFVAARVRLTRYLVDLDLAMPERNPTWNQNITRRTDGWPGMVTGTADKGR